MYDVQTASPHEWDGLVSQFPDRTVFHASAWLDAVASTQGFRLLLTKVLEGTACVAVWPCFEIWKGPFRILGSPLPGSSTPYLGPLFAADGDIVGVLKAMMATRMLGRSSYFACRAQDETRDVDLTPYRFTPVRRFETYLIDVGQSEAALWAKLSNECRNRIRKARKSGVEIRVEDGLDFMDDFWRTSQEVFVRSGIKPNYSAELLRRMWQKLRPAGQIVVLSGFLQDVRVGSLILPHDDRTMHYLAGGCRDRFLGLGANNLLQWEALLLAQRLGMERYDFVSSRGGPGRFKKTFGPVAVNYCTHWERSGSRLSEVLKTTYEKLARRRRRARSATRAEDGLTGSAAAAR